MKGVYRSRKHVFANIVEVSTKFKPRTCGRNMVGRAFSQCFTRIGSSEKSFENPIWEMPPTPEDVHWWNRSEWLRLLHFSPVEHIPLHFRQIPMPEDHQLWEQQRNIFPASFCNISVSGSNVTRPANASAVTISGLATKRRFLRFHRFVFKVSVKTRHNHSSLLFECHCDPIAQYTVHTNY